MSFDTDNNFSSLQFLESSVSKNDLLPNIVTGSSSAGHSQRVSVIRARASEIHPDKKFFPSPLIITKHKKQLSAHNILLRYETITLADKATYLEETLSLTKAQKQICNNIRLKFRNVIAAKKAKLNATSRFATLELKVDKAAQLNLVLRAKQTELQAFRDYMKAKFARASLQQKLGHAIG